MVRIIILLAAVLFLVRGASAADGDEPGRQALPPNDGWAAAEGGTIGGAAAERVVTVSSREELIRALGGDNVTNGEDTTPTIIRVAGTIDLGSDATGRVLTEADYADPAYSLDAYLAAYDPATWGREREVEGPLEEARQRSQENQARQTVVNVGSNKTIVGIGEDARIVGGTLMIKEADNVIVRNITFEDSYDYFPRWDPTDGELGEWNSEYDLISIVGATHVWIDHNSFTDGGRPDPSARTLLGRRIQHHDGAVDITNGANYVTVSWNRFKDHDKTNLVGSSDGRTSDADHLKVTFHHNHYENAMQRSPRVRYGRVHVYNNLYTARRDHPSYPYVYFLGIGKSSAIYAERNHFEVPEDIGAADLIRVYKGEAFHDQGSLRNGAPVDVLAAYNAAQPDATLHGDVGWKPELVGRMDPAQQVPELVKAGAGAGKV
jgi:pectate lyase